MKTGLPAGRQSVGIYASRVAWERSNESGPGMPGRVCLGEESRANDHCKLPRAFHRGWYRYISTNSERGICFVGLVVSSGLLDLPRLLRGMGSGTTHNNQETPSVPHWHSSGLALCFVVSWILTAFTIGADHQHSDSCTCLCNACRTGAFYWASPMRAGISRHFLRIRFSSSLALYGLSNWIPNPVCDIVGLESVWGRCSAAATLQVFLLRYPTHMFLASLAGSGSPRGV